MPKPAKGPKALPTSSVKASRLPSTGKKKRKPAAAAGEVGGSSGSSGGKRKKSRSFLGLLAAGAGFAALWGYNVWARVQQQRSDRRILDGMLRLPLNITEHAACRMDCRYVGRSEIVEALQSGRINSRKSQRDLKPCPKYTVDAAVGPRRKNVQCVFSACPAETRVVTVIDTDTDWPCPPC